MEFLYFTKQGNNPIKSFNGKQNCIVQFSFHVQCILYIPMECIGALISFRYLCDFSKQSIEFHVDLKTEISVAFESIAFNSDHFLSNISIKDCFERNLGQFCTFFFKITYTLHTTHSPLTNLLTPNCNVLNKKHEKARNSYLFSELQEKNIYFVRKCVASRHARRVSIHLKYFHGISFSFCFFFIDDWNVRWK